MKDKILKIILKISSLPFIVILLMLLGGYKWIDISNSKIDSFLTRFTFPFLMICLACVVYQSFYLISYLFKNEKNKKELALKSIFVVSFIPYIMASVFLILFILLQLIDGSTQSIWNGNVFEFITEFAKNIFRVLEMLLPYDMSFIVWIFPAYQIFYIIRHFIKKHKSKNVVADGNSELQDKS